MGKEVLSTVVEEVKLLIHYSVSVDSTPDVTHVNQLAVTIRYVKFTGPVERFLTILPMYGHTGAQIADYLLKFLAGQGIPIELCRGQSYDNASNMSGKYKGVQAVVRASSPYAAYVPCSAHSLNLVGKHVAEACSDGSEMFNLIQSLYNFFSGSTHRWTILKNNLEGLPVDKSLSETRRSATR
ncbi:zinc finger MYM-type protein 1-like [Dendronephthya gigantea]|uniref:zinc finger MYM-type protein 1-like n=1 Tax=Dendronephthya gigantea TaxID=151771 RepID=UPI00106BBA3C|nr:zinc finger MYM-type protein 1-like [Dendronephthya gigantea]